MCFQSQVLDSVHMMVEISPQHHDVVLGRNNKSLKGIMQRTSTQIVFQDPNDPNIPTLKKSNVTITGSINNVYLARQQLIVRFFFFFNILSFFSNESLKPFTKSSLLLYYLWVHFVLSELNKLL
jgi:hypothetical protein